MGQAKGRGNKPPSSEQRLAKVGLPPNFDEESPKFCLRYIQKGFDVHSLNQEQQAAFARTLQKLAQSKWKELITAPRHGQGCEHIPVAQLKATIPHLFQDQDKVMVFRYDGKLPMAGVRIQDVFHVLFIEPCFGVLYDHE